MFSDSARPNSDMVFYFSTPDWTKRTPSSLPDSSHFDLEWLVSMGNGFRLPRRSRIWLASNSRVSDLSGAGVQQLIDPYLELEWGTEATAAAPGAGPATIRAPHLRQRRDSHHRRTLLIGFNVLSSRSFLGWVAIQPTGNCFSGDFGLRSRH